MRPPVSQLLGRFSTYPGLLLRIRWAPSAKRTNSIAGSLGCLADKHQQCEKGFTVTCDLLDRESGAN